MPTQTYAAKELIIQEGSSAEAAFIVQSGSVQLLRHGPQGESAIATLTAGKCFGELAVLEPGSPYAYSARALEPAAINRMTRDEFMALMAQCPIELQPLIDCAFDQFRRTALRGGGTAEAAATLGDIKRISIRPASDAVKPHMDPVMEVMINRLPFKIGGYPIDGEINSTDGNNLFIPAKAPPLAVSRQHCQIEVADEKLVLLDLGSRFNTVVNGVSIGRGRGHYKAVLTSGENHIKLGGEDSIYALTIVVEQA